MASISPDLESRLQRNPNTLVSLIVRLKGDASAHLADVQARGLTVRRTYSLISAIAIQGTASASLTLMDEPWVLSLEEDRTVHTM